MNAKAQMAVGLVISEERFLASTRMTSSCGMQRVDACLDPSLRPLAAPVKARVSVKSDARAAPACDTLACDTLAIPTLRKISSDERLLPFIQGRLIPVPHGHLDLMSAARNVFTW